MLALDIPTMPRGPYDPYLKDAIGGRLKLTRLALGIHSQAEFVRVLGTPEITAQHWNNWESGRVRMGMDAAQLVIERLKQLGYGRISLDWIYRGEINDGMSTSIARAIGALEAAQHRKNELDRKL